ncbi:MAG: radical SAM protein, partial [Acidimicrobiia bacterium]
MIVTFCRVRPASLVNELTATTRRREGTTVIEVDDLSSEVSAAAASGGLLPVGTTPPTTPLQSAAAWVIGAEDALKSKVAGWRLTIDAGSTSHEHVLDAAARTCAAFIRSPRSRVADLAGIASLPGLVTSISVFVDDIDQAVAAVESGATDLLLRDWDNEGLAELRQAMLPSTLVERTAFPLTRPSATAPGSSPGIEDLRTALSPALFTAWLHQVDGSGAVRPRVAWAPGKDIPVPVPPARISAQWTDPIWIAGRAPSELAAGGDLRPLLEAALAGNAPKRDEVERLFRARSDQVDAIAWTADQLRRRRVGEMVTYVINRNINYTNQCYFKCGFCAFSKGPRSLNMREEPYLIPLEGIVGLAQEAWDRGATEVTLQGGIHPEFTGDFYASVVEGIKERLPAMHIHGFTPLEVWQGAETLGVPVRQFLMRLHDAGLGSLPGTAAEVLDDSVREHLCPDKIRTSQWAEVMITAHEIGLRATATLMFGHIDHPAAWANHFEVIRQIQRRTGGFTEFVPLPFVHMGAP